MITYRSIFESKDDGGCTINVEVRVRLTSMRGVKGKIRKRLKHLVPNRDNWEQLSPIEMYNVTIDKWEAIR